MTGVQTCALPICNDLEEIFRKKYPSFQLYEIVRENRIIYPHETTRAQAEDLILVKGTANDFLSALQDGSVILPHHDKNLNYAVTDKDTFIVELIIPPQSPLIGERLIESRLQHNSDIHIIAVKRRQLHYTEQKLREMQLRIGDIILVRCSKETLDRFRGEPDFIPIEDVHHEIFHKRKARVALIIFTGMITAATTGLADIMASALTAVFLMLLTGCLNLRDAYRALRADVLLLIAGTIALGAAMEKTGASRIYAEAFLGIFEGAGPRIVLGGIVLLTSVGTQLLSNNATAVLLIPIAISTAVSLNVDPKPFIIAVCFGASACYATPIGYQTNLMVYGPGSYRFMDYLKLGIPLNLIVLFLGTIFIPVFWPF